MRLRAAAIIAAAGLAITGCGFERAPDDLDLDFGEPLPAHEAERPEGYRDATPREFRQAERAIGAGADELLGEGGGAGIDLLESWVRRGRGPYVSIDVQTERMPGEISLDTYDQVAIATLSQSGVIEVIGGPETYGEMDGLRATVIDLAPLTGQGLYVRGVSTVRGSVAVNVAVTSTTRDGIESAEPALRSVIESWRWLD